MVSSSPAWTPTSGSSRGLVWVATQIRFCRGALPACRRGLVSSCYSVFWCLSASVQLGCLECHLAVRGRTAGRLKMGRLALVECFSFSVLVNSCRAGFGVASS